MKDSRNRTQQCKYVLRPLQENHIIGLPHFYFLVSPDSCQVEFTPSYEQIREPRNYSFHGISSSLVMFTRMLLAKGEG